MIDRERLVSEFLALVQISSPSKREGEVARRLLATLEGMGARVETDDAGEKVGGNCGNILARFAGTASDAPPLLLSAHMDTVLPCDHVRPVVQGDIIRTDGTTVLGGDDKAGIVAVLEAVRSAHARRIPHGPIEVLFTIGEEIGLVGAKHFDLGRLTARTGLVLDVDGVHDLVTQAPAANALLVTVQGLEAHAGVCPERGLSAIAIAAQAVAGMRLGRIDAETTANLGVIEGGLAANIVPNRVRVRGETRSLSVEKLEAQTAHMRGCFERAAAAHRLLLDGQEHTGRCEVRVQRNYERLNLREDARIVRLVGVAAQRLGRPFRTRATGGGSDANVFSSRGLEVANLACGMRDIHTVHEWVDVKDLVATAEHLVELLQVNAEQPD
jgi:tripeptide aminopeptidase